MSDHLFAEMDAIADALRANDPTLRESLSDELQLEFRQLQKKRMPWLSKQEFLDLFHTWRDHYLARLEADLAELRKCEAENDCKLAALVAERNARNPHLNRFVCKCGAVLADPFDPDMLALHDPHFVAASLDRVQEGLERHRAWYVR